jgi:hypothetical protein
LLIFLRMRRLIAHRSATSGSSQGSRRTLALQLTLFAQTKLPFPTLQENPSHA